MADWRHNSAAALYALLPLVVVLSHRSFAIFVALLALALGSDPFWSCFRGGLFVRRLTALQVAMASTLVFIGYVALSGLWHDPLQGVSLSAMLASGFVLALALCASLWSASAVPPYLLARYFLLAFLMTCLLLLIEAVSGGWIRTVVPPQDQSTDRIKDMAALGRGLTVMVVVAFAAGFFIWDRRVLPKLYALRYVVTGGILVSLIWGGFAFGISANFLMLIVGIAAALLTRLAPQSGITLAFGGWALTMLALPFVMAALPMEGIYSLLGGLPVSWVQRFFIWDFGAERVLECLPFGCGADYARQLYEQGRQIGGDSVVASLPVMPTHPHNLFLQVWMELGVIGALSATVALVAAMKLVLTHMHRSLFPLLAATLAALYVSAMMEMTLWQIWRVYLVVFVVYLFCLMNKLAMRGRGVEDGNGKHG